MKWSKNKTLEMIIVKLGYETKIKVALTRGRLWQWKSNKIQAWDNGQKRSQNGPSKCIILKKDSENVDHIFASCLFTKSMWKEVIQGMNGTLSWDKIYPLYSFEYWIIDKFISTYKYLPCFVLWGHLLTKKKMIMEGMDLISGISPSAPLEICQGDVTFLIS